MKNINTLFFFNGSPLCKRGVRGDLISGLFILFIFLTGCVNLQPGSSRTLNTYTINSVATVHAPHTQRVMLVTPMRASAETETAQMNYIKTPYALMHFAQNRWVAPPATMITPLIVQTLQNTKYYHAVAFFPFSGNVDYRLDTELLTLQQEFIHSPSQVRLVIQARVVDAQTSNILATKRIEVTGTATKDDPYSGVLATNTAVNDALKQLAKFCVTLQ